MAIETKSAKSETTVFSSTPELMEFLNNVIQDAQASGCIVHMVTIIPPHIQQANDSGGVDIKSCQPKASTCPK